LLVVTGEGALGQVMAGGGMIVVCDGSEGLVHVASSSAPAASPIVRKPAATRSLSRLVKTTKEV
jgi:hypothetical protein